MIGAKEVGGEGGSFPQSIIPRLILLLTSPWRLGEKSSIKPWTRRPDKNPFYRKTKGQSEITGDPTWLCKFGTLKVKIVDETFWEWHSPLKRLCADCLATIKDVVHTVHGNKSRVEKVLFADILSLRGYLLLLLFFPFPLWWKNKRAPDDRNRGFSLLTPDPVLYPPRDASLLSPRL